MRSCIFSEHAHRYLQNILLMPVLAATTPFRCAVHVAGALYSADIYLKSYLAGQIALACRGSVMYLLQWSWIEFSFLCSKHWKKYIKSIFPAVSQLVCILYKHCRNNFHWNHLLWKKTVPVNAVHSVFCEYWGPIFRKEMLLLNLLKAFLLMLWALQTMFHETLCIGLMAVQQLKAWTDTTTTICAARYIEG